MDYDRWKALNDLLEHPARTQDNEKISPWPSIGFAGRTGADKVPSSRSKTEETWAKLEAVNVAARAIATTAEEHAAAVLADDKYSESGKAEVLEEYRNREVVPKLRDLREMIFSPAAKNTQQQLESAYELAMNLPEHPYLISADMAALPALRERNAKKRLSPMEITALPMATRRAIAMTDPIASGLSEPMHKIVRNEYLRESGGAALVTAEEQVAAVEAVSTTLDLAEVVADRAAGTSPLTPAGAAAARARAEREEGDTPN